MEATYAGFETPFEGMDEIWDVSGLDVTKLFSQTP